MAILNSVDVSAAVNTEAFRVDRTRKIQNITFCSRTSAAQNLRLFVVPKDTTLADKHAWMYDVNLPGNAPLLFPMNAITLEYGDIIWVYGSEGSLSVNVAD